MKNIRDVFNIFGPEAVQVSILAGEINQVADTVRRWRFRGKIPAKHWQAVIDAAGARGEVVSADALMRMHRAPLRKSRRHRKSVSVSAAA